MNFAHLLGRKSKTVAAVLASTFDESPTINDVDDELRIEFPTTGIEFLFSPEDKLHTVFFFAKGDYRSSGFTGNLPCGIDFSTSQRVVREKVGEPNEFSIGGTRTILGVASPWDAFIVENFRLHVRYSEDHQSIKQISISMVA